MSYNIGPKIGIDGENEFRNQLKKINDTYKALTAETKAATAAFDANGDEQGKLKKTGELLQKQIDQQKQKTALLTDAVEKAKAKFGENSIEVIRLEGALYDAQAETAQLEQKQKELSKQLAKSADNMEEMGEETEEASGKAADFGDMLAANFLSDFLMDGLTELAGKLKDIAGESIQAAADVQAETAQFEQTFGDLKDTATGALEEISGTTNIAVTRLQGSYTKLYAFAKTAGVDQEKALDLSGRALLAAADSAAYYDRSIEEALESLQAFMKGNFANDAALGISCTETTRNAKANELYAKSFKDLTEAQKVETLLAMVEAGNAASGAMGQAARESEAWTNITGELSEAWRQLLAKVGAPVLKKITPIVQDITKSLDEIAEEIDWDKFGDTVCALVDFLLSTLPKLAKGLVAIGAGFAAMKLTTTIVSIVKTATALVKAAQAAKTAGLSIKTLAAAMNTTPWGLAATAIGVLVSAITAISLSAEDSEASCVKAFESIKEGIDDLNKSYEDTSIEIEATASMTKNYIDRLRELEASGLKTAEAQNEYAAVVDALNELYPELNLFIDENTGLMNMSTEAVEEFAEAQKKAAQVAAKKELYQGLFAETENLRLSLAAANQELETLINSEDNGTIIPVGYASYFVNKDRSETKEQIRLIKNVIDETTKAIEKNEFQLELLWGDIKSVGEAGGEAGGKIASGADAAVQAVIALQEAYESTKSGAEESLNSQISLWEELKLESEYTAESIIENWKAQKKAFEDYDKNLRTAANKGMDWRLLQSLSDGSAESMMLLDALVNDANITVEEINTAFGERMDIQGELAETMGAVNLFGMPEAQQIISDSYAIGEDIVDALVDTINSSTAEIENAAVGMGVNVADAVMVGLGSRESALEASMRHAGEVMHRAFTEFWMIKSPSKLMEKDVSWIIDGGVISVDKNAYKLENAMERLGDITTDAALADKLMGATDYIGSSAARQTINTKNSYGGFSFHIYQQPGEDANALADRVMERMKTVVDQKEAVFR